MSVKKRRNRKTNTFVKKTNEDSVHQDEPFFFGTLSLEDEKYFKGVEETLMTHHFSQEDYKIFIDNTFAEIEGKELKLAIHPLYSKTLESLLQILSPIQLKKYFQSLIGNFKKLIFDCFGSHVCETLLIRSAYIASTENIYSAFQDSGEILVTMENLILFMCNEISDMLINFADHKYASYVFRQLLFVLDGSIFQDNLSSKRTSKNKRKPQLLGQINSTKQLTMPESFFEKKKSILDNINAKYSATQVRNLAFNQYGSQIISTLLLIEKNLVDNDKERNQNLLEKLIFGDFKDISLEANSIQIESDSFMETLLRDQVGSHIFESIIEFSSEEILQKLYVIYFKDKILRISKHPVANYVLQKFIEKNNNYKILDEIVGKIIMHFKELIDIGHIGVLVSLINVSSHITLISTKLLNVLKECFGGSETDIKNSIFSLILNLDPRNENNSMKNFEKELNNHNRVVDHIKIQGAHLIKSLFNLPYEMYYFLIESFLLQNKKVVLYYATNKIGSCIVETILKLPSLLASDRRKLLNNFFESYAYLSCDPFGSHIVDACLFTSIGLNSYRERIANELLKSREIIEDNYYGKRVWKNWHINLFKNKYSEWKKNINSYVEKGLSELKADRIVNIHISDVDSLNDTNKRTSSLTLSNDKEKLTDGFNNDLEEITMLFRKHKKKKL
ncbi:hypothetical protein T552_02277 [Pneumocystis carinii B80]|uniref:Nucleolar protein 9 n=1 Tax=Pneumocystis carinii (strain B80) TaxID=1408658 RepID=A0A0W4ZFZ3_PNEC8|nr:hypothetical protein T552_02277 [Pneumocystis carinii B80]KTW27294.1 hypothetical protein T552_02277 [Pneumocystis carinii B80]